MFGALGNGVKGLISRVTDRVPESFFDELSDMLLDYDVSYEVVDSIIEKLKSKFETINRIPGVSMQQQLLAKLQEEVLEQLSGHQDGGLDVKRYDASLNLSGSPTVWMMCGVQGMGKTSSAVKVARLLSASYKKRVLIAACDRVRFGAVDQLKQLAASAGIMVFHDEQIGVLDNATAAIEFAKHHRYDVVIIDTAGRMHPDDNMMQELETLYELVKPQELLLVVSVMYGQTALNDIRAFKRRLNISGAVVTMLDGSAKGGVCLSFGHDLRVPIKFECFGERVSDIHLFNAKGLANRILGFGDTINLVRKAQLAFEESKSCSIKEVGMRLMSGKLNFNDLIRFSYILEKMGGLKYIMNMLPGLQNSGKISSSDMDDYSRMKIVVNSMTPSERKGVKTFTPSRIVRIAKGAGVSDEHCKRVIKMPETINKMMGKMRNQGFMMKGWR